MQNVKLEKYLNKIDNSHRFLAFEVQKGNQIFFFRKQITSKSADFSDLFKQNIQFR